MSKDIIPALKMIYPYDNTAQDKGNYISDDVKVIPPNGGKVVAASKGAFYADTLVIRKGQETLQLGTDYELAGFYQEATEETKEEMIEAFYRSCQFEYLFWEMATTHETWKLEG